MDTEKSRILIIGGTGTIGKHIVEASVKCEHPTYVLIRESTVSNPAKSSLVNSFKALGVQLIHGDLYDHESLVKAVKQVHIVISAVHATQISDQVNIIAAIKDAGDVKRFIPSEFGYDVDRVHAVEPATKIFDSKAKIRRAIEAEGIPYTYICSYGFAGHYLVNFGQENAKSPPRDKVVIFRDGHTKAVYVEEKDIGTYTIKAADDPRTLNNVVELKPPANILSYNNLIALWEKKIGKTLEKIFLSEDEVLRRIEESTPKNFMLSLHYTVIGVGVIPNNVEDCDAIEATSLYPEVKYTTVDDYLDRFVQG